MGTDIRWHVERRNKEGVWVPVGTYEVTFDYGDEYWHYTFNDPPGGWRVHGRNYYMFSALSDVRNNGTHFKEGVPVMPLNGLPADTHPIIRKVWHDDCYSESHATLRELREANWDILDTSGHSFKKSVEYEDLSRVLVAMGKIDGVKSPDDVRAIWWFC